MLAIGVDIGTTTLCGVITNSVTGEIEKAVTLDNHSAVEGRYSWERLQDPDRILSRVKHIIAALSEGRTQIGAIGITGQMHGIVYVNAEGEAVSPLFTWQDGRGDLPKSNGKSYAGYLSEKTGHSLATGYGAVTHFYNEENGLVPETAVRICTIHAYTAMRLSGQREPVLHMSDGAGLGLFDKEKNIFDLKAVRQAGISPSLLPSVTKDTVPIGTTPEGVPVCPAIGDNQASFIGSVKEPETGVLVNVGTGSQISRYINAFALLPGMDTRPLDRGGYLLVGAPLCGGSAYALLEGFYRSVLALASEKPGLLSGKLLYNAMDKAVLALLDKESTHGLEARSELKVSPLFSGTREEPQLRGAITQIAMDNFTPEQLALGFLKGMAAQLYGYYEDMVKHTGAAPQYLVGSGNGIRKNLPLKRVLEKTFGLPLKIPRYKEEASYGASLLALASTGGYKDMAEARMAIRYE